MIFNRWILGLLFFSAVLFVGFGTSLAETKVGVMNVQKIVNLSAAGKVASGEIDKRMKELQQKFKGEEDELVTLQAEIEKKSSAWSESKKAEKVREFQKLRREMQAKTEDARFEIKQLQDKRMAPILKALEGVVNSYGEKNGYTVIFDANFKGGVIFYDKAVDVTEGIIKELDAAMAK